MSTIYVASLGVCNEVDVMYWFSLYEEDAKKIVKHR